MLQVCKELFDIWNSEHILYCHWKSNEHLSAGLNGETDLDILLSRYSEGVANQVFKRLGFVNIKSQFGSRYPGVTDWLGFDEKTGKLVHVHLHFVIVTGHRGLKEYNLPWSELALETRVFDEDAGVYTMEPTLELLTLYTRIGLKADAKKIINAKKGKFKISCDTQKEIDYLKARIEKDEFEILLRKYYPNGNRRLKKIIEKQEVGSKDLLELIDVCEAEMKQYCRIPGILRSLYKNYYALLLVVRLKIKRRIPIITRKTVPSGLMIAFVGQDGAGKSSVTTEIEKWLSWKLEVRRFYLGSGDHYKSWQRTLQERLPVKKGKMLSIFSAILVLSMYKRLSKYVLHTIKSAKKYKNKGGIALFDRYPQTLFPGINDGPKIMELAKKTSNNFLKKVISIDSRKEEKYLKEAERINPDILFKLTLSPEDSIRRKPFENLETVKRKHEIIKNLSYDGAKIYEIDATMDYQKELVLIKTIIWQNIQK